MRLSTLLAATLGLAFTLPAAAQSPPPNDRFDQAIPIVVGQDAYTGSNVDAFAETDASNPTASCQSSDAGNSVYWAVRSSTDGNITMDLRGSSFDTVVTLLDGFSFAEIGCDDDGIPGDGDTTSILTAPVLAGFVYLIRVTGFNGADGDIAMEVTASDGATLQTASDPGSLYELPLTDFGSYIESNIGATLQAGEVAPSCQSNYGASIWRRFVAPSSGPVTIDLRGSSFDTVLNVYSFSSGLPTDEIGCDDDGIPGDGDLASILEFDAVAGTEYMVRISGFSDRTGDVMMTISDGPFVASEETPEGTVALNVAPNPVAASARVALDLPVAQAVSVELFDVRGRRVATLHEGEAAAGRLDLPVDASALPAGVYIVRVAGETVQLTERFTVAR